MTFRTSEFGRLEVEFETFGRIWFLWFRENSEIDRSVYIHSADVERDGRLRAKRARPHCTTRETRNRRQKLTQYRCPRASIPPRTIGYQEPTPPHTSHSASFSFDILFRFDSCTPSIFSISFRISDTSAINS